MGPVYNVPPIRTKEIPYVDVITESFNNPIRLLLGWFAVTAGRIPEERLISPTILPSPVEVVRSFPSLWFDRQYDFCTDGGLCPQGRSRRPLAKSVDHVGGI